VKFKNIFTFVTALTSEYKNIMKKIQHILLCLCAFFLTSCANHVTSIKKDVDITLDPVEGYLMMAVDTNYSLEWIKLWGKKNVILTKGDLKSGSNYILVNLPAGDYRIESIKLGRFTFNDFEKRLWSFSVKKGVISYVGHLEMESKGSYFSVSSHIQLLNKSSFALEYLEDKFPNILNSRQIQYWGPGEDGFFTTVMTEKEVLE